ncbi:MAG: chromosomal replication initiator protein DnaA [Planctomycetota bacterium]
MVAHNTTPQPDTNSRETELLKRLLTHLVANVRREQLETWFRSIVVARADDAEIELSVTSQFVRDWLKKNFLPQLQKGVDSLDGKQRRLVLSHRPEDGKDSLSLIQTSSRDEIESIIRNSMNEQAVNEQAVNGQAVNGQPVHGQAHTNNRLGASNGPASSNGASQQNHTVQKNGTGVPGVPKVDGVPLPPQTRTHPAAAHSTGAGSVPARPGPSGQQPSSQQPSSQQPSDRRQSNQRPSADRRAGNPLNPNYTFDRFVVGPCNRLAHASALAIGENPGHAYNPLFVHGNVGLGKTHLLQAICHTVLRRDPNARVLYMSCEDFTNSYIQAVQSHAIDSFRDYHRGADVLVIDDVQFLADKQKTQDEFFHTFNALFDGQRQIVLSSDRPPVEIPTIEERLVSRFKWGLVAEVEAPCIDTRKAIVCQKAAGRGVELPDDVAGLLAERVTSNIRELEGAVIKVVGFAAITEQPITTSLAESCLRGMPMRRAQVTSDEVMTLITGEFAITARELIGKSRTQAVSMPRQIAMYLLREHTESSLEDIGKFFGNRDHTTVIYAVNKIRERATKDRMFKELLDGLSSRLVTRAFRT